MHRIRGKTALDPHQCPWTCYPLRPPVPPSLTMYFYPNINVLRYHFHSSCIDNCYSGSKVHPSWEKVRALVLTVWGVAVKLACVLMLWEEAKAYVLTLWEKARAYVLMLWQGGRRTNEKDVTPALVLILLSLISQAWCTHANTPTKRNVICTRIAVLM